jgi:hypothetical protein
MTNPALATAAAGLAMPGSNRRTSAARVRAYLIAPPDHNARVQPRTKVAIVAP